MPKSPHAMEDPVLHVMRPLRATLSGLSQEIAATGFGAARKPLRQVRSQESRRAGRGAPGGDEVDGRGRLGRLPLTMPSSWRVPSSSQWPAGPYRQCTGCGELACCPFPQSLTHAADRHPPTFIDHSACVGVAGAAPGELCGASHRHMVDRALADACACATGWEVAFGRM